MRLKSMVQQEKYLDLRGLSGVLDNELKQLILIEKLYPEDVKEWLQDEETTLFDNLSSNPQKIKMAVHQSEENQCKAYDEYFSLLPEILSELDSASTCDLEVVDLRICMTVRAVNDFIQNDEKNWKDWNDLDLIVDRIIEVNNEILDGPCMLLFLSCYALHARKELLPNLELTDEDNATVRLSFELKAVECLLRFHAIYRKYELDKSIENKEHIIRSKEKDVTKKDKVICKREKKIEKLEKDVQRLKESLKKKKLNERLNSAQTEHKTNDINSISKEKDKNPFEDRNVEEMENKIKELTARLNSKSDKMDSFKRKIKDLSEEAEREKSLGIHDRLENYLRAHGIDAAMIQILHPYWEDYMEGRKVLPSKDKVLGRTKIGTCHIMEKEHYIQFPDGERQKVFNLEDDTLLAVGQFLRVDVEGRFQESYHAWCPEYLLEETCEWYGKVISVEGKQAQVQIFEDDIREVRMDSTGIYEGWIVGGNANEIKTVFPGYNFHLASIKDSADAREIEVLWTIELLKSGAICRNVYSGEQVFRSLDDSDYSQISSNSLLFMRNGRVVNVFKDGKHYTHSKLYKHSRTGVFLNDNNHLLLKMSNGESHLVTNVPEGIEPGSRILTDECYRYIRLLGRKTSPTSSTKNTEEAKNLPPLKEETILIIGNIGLANSYQREFRKAGYQVMIADGTREWGHIRSACSGADLILLDTSHMQHKIYYKCMDELQGSSVYLHHGSGPQKMIQYVRAVLEA
ncbi:hypothetical protein JR334_00610 [Clostridia bacterium]|nr:hypothetical protein JR334_00610 [Clostridia bacterium]